MADYAFAPAGPATAGQGRTPAEPGAHRASLDGMDLVRPARHKQANKFLCLPSPGSTVMDVSGTSAQALVRTWIKSIQKRTESCIRILAGAGNFDLQSVSGKAPTGEFTRYPISQLAQPHAPSRRRCSYLAIFRPGQFRKLGHFFSSPESCFARQRACDSSARGSRAEESVNGYRIVLRPSQTVRSTSNADDNRMHW